MGGFAFRLHSIVNLLNRDDVSSFIISANWSDQYEAG